MPTEVLLATRNPHKLAELRRILADVQPDLRVIGLDDAAPYDEVPETARHLRRQRPDEGPGRSSGDWADHRR